MNGTHKVDGVQAESQAPQQQEVGTHRSNGVTVTKEQQRDVHRITVLREATGQIAAKFTREYGASSHEIKQLLGSDHSVETFIDFITAERLRRMPHRGSKWDKVLQWAEFFVSQIHFYQEALSSVVSYTEEATRLVLGSCRTLLEEKKIFGVFYNMSLTLAVLLRTRELFTINDAVRGSLAAAFTDLLNMVTDVTIHYTKSRSAESSIEFDALFGRALDKFFLHKDRVSDAMWNYQLENASTNIVVSIESIRRFLAHNDHAVEVLLTNRLGTRSSREEFTCEWFQSHLTNFLRSSDRVFLVTGKPGCGKSVLFEFLVERLRRSQGRKQYDVISYSLDPDVKTENSPLSVVKALLLQLIERQIGDVKLYERISVAYRKASTNASEIEVENALWSALSSGIHTRDSNTNVVIAVDGLDHIGNEHVASRLLDRLHDITVKQERVKAIALSRPLKKPGSHHARLFTIEASDTSEDLHHYVRSIIKSSSKLRGIPQQEKEKIIQRVSTTADGSFIWAIVMLEVLRKEKTLPGILQMLDNAPKTVEDAILKLLATLDLKDKDTRSILAWLLASERPLTVSEIKQLLELDVASCSHIQRFTNPEDDVLHSVGPLVSIQDGIVRFRHHTVRQQLEELATSVKDFSNTDAKFPFNLKEAHYDLVCRSLMYVKITVKDKATPSIHSLPQDRLIELFQKNSFLEYVSRYWILHFQASPMFDAAGKHKLVAEFKKCFTASTLLALLEYSCWSSLTTRSEALKLHLITLHLRRDIVGEKTESVLQNTITLARVCERLSRHNEASDYYFQAYKLSQDITQDNTLIADLVTGYVNCASTSSFTTRNESVDRHEAMLRYIISTRKQEYGASHELTIKYLKMLVQLYQRIREFDHAIDIQRDLYEASIERYGRYHSETVAFRETLVQLLEQTSRKDEITKLQLDSYQAARRDSSFGTNSGTLTSAMNIVNYYESKKDVSKAEELLVDMWQAVVEIAQTTKDVSVQERKIQVALQYAKFLERHNRTQESESILVGLWSEYEEVLTTSSSSLQTDTMTSSIISIGQHLKRIGAVTTAQRIFKSTWNYYKRQGKQTTSEASSCAVLLAETTKEVAETQKTSLSYSEEEEETILKEMFESVTTLATSEVSSTETSHIHSSNASTQSSLVSTAESLSTKYVRQERWTDAVDIYTSTLKLIWPDVLVRKQPALPSQNRPKAVEFAQRLAFCYFSQRQIVQAEYIYRYLLNAAKATLHIQDPLVVNTMNDLVSFYDKTYQFDKIIDVYAEICSELKTKLSATDKATISTLYSLAKLCEQQQKFKEAEKYYYEIFIAFGKDAITVHEDAIPAILALCAIHRRNKQWEAARYFYAKIWTTFLQKGTEYKWTTGTVEKIYTEYTSILEKELKADYETIRKITMEYREACTKVFGTSNELTVKATVTLAQVNERNEKYREEAVTLYEEVLKQSTSSTTTLSTSTLSLISQSKQKLGHFYATKSSTSSKAISVYTEEYESTVKEHGYSSETSIQRLSELTTFFSKQTNEELHKKSVELLQKSALQIVSTEKDSQRLFNSAVKIAKLYVQSNQKEHAYSLLQEMRRQIISEDYQTSKSGISLKGADRRSYVFIVAFEEALKGSESRSLFSEIMADLMTETLLYQRYTQSTKQKAKFEILFSHGSRLLMFLKRKNRQEEYTRIETELFDVFVTQMQASKSSKILREFFELCVREMGKNEFDVSVVDSATSSVLKYTNAGQFAEAYELAVYLYKFMGFYDSFYNPQNVGTGFKLCLYLAGRETKPCTDQKLRQQMMQLSASLLSEILDAAQKLKMQFVSLPIRELNQLVGLLGEQKDWSTLKTILSALWESRHTAHWSPQTAINIVRRLIEVLFVANEHAHALHLCEDVCYNLRRVWGPFDATTLETYRLLAELYTAGGQVSKALAVHEDILRQTIIAVDEDGDISVEQGAEIAGTEMELLKRAYLRLGGWKDKDVAAYTDLQSQLSAAFKDQKAWNSKSAVSQGVEKWSTKEKADDLGSWKQPSSFEFLAQGDEIKKSHISHWRRISSGSYSVSGMSGGFLDVGSSAVGGAGGSKYGSLEYSSREHPKTPVKA